jgi:hypothetical protein
MGMVFPVEIWIDDEEALTVRLAAVRQWLHRCRSEPSTFRYIFLSPAVLLRIDFPAEAEAVAFARQFGGRIT